MVFYRWNLCKREKLIKKKDKNRIDRIEACCKKEGGEKIRYSQTNIVFKVEARY